MREARDWGPALALTMLVAGAYLLELRSWVGASETFAHMDGAIHLERLHLYADHFAGIPVEDEPRQIVGYGPLVYVLGASLMNLLDARGWATAVWVPMLMGAVGVVGTGILAGRLSRPWAAPAAAAVLVGLPTWRTHSVDVMVDLPGAAWTVLAVACLVDAGPRSSQGPARGWLAGAAVATGLALMTRWPMAFVLGPAWALAAVQWAWRAPQRGRALGLGVPLLGVVAGLVVVAPVAMGGWGVVLWGRLALSLGAAVVGAGLVWGQAHWLARGLGAVALMGAALWPATLWSPQGFLDPMAAQLALEEGWDASGVYRPGLAGIPHGLVVLGQWVVGPWLGLLAVVGAAWCALRRPARALVVVVPAAANIGLLFTLVAQPDDRHVLASVPLAVGLAVALLAQLPGRRLRGTALAAVAAVGLLGLGARHLPGAPGVVDATAWKRDINLVREPTQGAESMGARRLIFPQSGLPWVSLAPLEASPIVAVATLLGEGLGTGPGCVAWLVDPSLREAVHLPRTSAALEAALMSVGSGLMGEEPTDRPGARVQDYDGAVVFAPAGSPLSDAATTALAPAQVVGQVAGPDWTATVVSKGPADASDPAEGSDPAGDCAARFPDTPILPIATGWPEIGHYPGLAPHDSQSQGEAPPPPEASPPPQGSP